MDGSRFDAWTKEFATRRSRRTLLRGLTGGALAAMGLGRSARASCSRDKPIRCGSACVDLRADPANCGRCDNACAAGAVCYAGRCMSACPAGFLASAGTCVRSCPVGETGCDGTCVPACRADQVFDAGCACVCPAGQTECAGLCRDVDTDPAHCGACDAPCGSDETCVAGDCVADTPSYGINACDEPTTVCDATITLCPDTACWAMPSTNGACACAKPPGRARSNPCGVDAECEGAARCSDTSPGFCFGDFHISCTRETEGTDCAALAVCQDGFCGGPICATDVDCHTALGLNTVCISGEALPCTADGANICWTLCHAA